MTTVTLIGAGGKMGCRITDNLKASEYAMRYVEVSPAGVENSLPTPGVRRQVTDDNSPTVVNAVFNHRNFFNARAQPDFNGVNPFGKRDANARVYQADLAGNKHGLTDFQWLTHEELKGVLPEDYYRSVRGMMELR